jgi:CheY-like chemotaxis protein
VIKILYVEDNDDNIYVLKTPLELLEEFEVVVAEWRRASDSTSF